MIATMAAFCALGLVATPSAGQKKPSVAEAVPYQGVIEVNLGGIRAPLEVQPAAIPRMSGGVLSLGSGQMFYELPGKSSTFRIPRQGKFYFVTRSMGEGADPAMFFKLYRAEGRKKDRRIKISTSSFSQRMTIDLDKNAVPVRYESGSGGLVRIYPTTPLDAGEYAFLLEGRAFAFGID